MRHLIYITIALFIFAACNKKIPVKEISFSVASDSATYHHGSTVRFQFTGNPDNITAYSGAWGSRYANAYRLSDTSGTDILTFSSAVNTAGASGTLTLLVSTDFSNDTSKISNATWTDVSTLTPITWATGTTATPSGPIDLSSYKAAGKLIWLAFRYTATAGTTQQKWTINPLTLIHRPTNDTTYTILNLTATNPAYGPGAPPLVTSPGWVAVNQSRNPFAGQTWTPAVSSTSATALVINGFTVALSAPDTEQWMVAGPVDLSRVLHDVPTAVVKNIASSSAPMLTPPFSTVYSSPGAYTATFIATNATVDGLDSVVKQLSITVK